MEAARTKKTLLACSPGGKAGVAAKAIAKTLGESCSAVQAGEAPDPSKFDFVALCVELRDGWPDGESAALMKKCRGKSVAVAILAEDGESDESVQRSAGRIEGLLDSSRVVVQTVCRADALESDAAKAAELFREAWTGTAAEANGPIAKRALLLAAFGTATEGAKAAYKSIESAVAEARPGEAVRWAFSSGMVRAKLRKSGESPKSVSSALSALLREGFDAVDVLPLYLTNGEEFHKIFNEISAFRNPKRGFKEIRIGKPLMNSAESLAALCEAAIASAPAEREAGDALVFMGHGHNDGRSDLLYIAAGSELAKKDPLAFIACVEGKPGFEELLDKLRTAGTKKAFLIPFMVVAGDHAVNDLAGDEPESWKSRLQADGIECACSLKGLGESAKAVQIFLDGLAEA